HGYRANVREVVRRLLEATRLHPEQFARVVLYGPDARSHAQTARELGFAPAQVQDALFGKVGNAGAALVPLLLAAALERAKAGERLLVVGYGDGADALVLETTAGWSGSRAAAASPGTSRGGPSLRATTSTCASASSSPPSTTAAPARAFLRPSTSATGPPT